MEDDMNCSDSTSKSSWGAVRVHSLQQVRVGVEVSDQRTRNALKEEGKLPFVTGHSGSMAKYSFW